MVSPVLAWGNFHARSRFARSTIPEEKWGTTRSLPPQTFLGVGHAFLPHVGKERVTHAQECLRGRLCSRRSRAQLRQGVVLLSVKNNVTKSGKKQSFVN